MSLLADLLCTSDTLTLALLPYTSLLTVPAMGLMTDADPGVRATASAAFGRLVSILPMAAQMRPPQLLGLDPALREKRCADQAFLEQLLDSNAVADFAPPVLPSGVTLRSYQRDGVSWLAFLQRFGLQGILADDMGLGKTVQARPSPPPCSRVCDRCLACEHLQPRCILTLLAQMCGGPQSSLAIKVAFLVSGPGMCRSQALCSADADGYRSSDARREGRLQ